MRNLPPAALFAILFLALPLHPDAAAQDAPLVYESPADAPLAAYNPSLFHKITAPPDQIKSAVRPRSDPYSRPDITRHNPRLGFTIVTELTDEGRRLPPPSFRSPVYYQMIPGPSGQFQDNLVETLASNGYRPADNENSPTQILRILWGEQETHELSPQERALFFRVTRTPSPASKVPSKLPEPGTSLNFDSVHNIKTILSRAKVIGGNNFASDMAKAMDNHIKKHIMHGIDGPYDHFRKRDRLTMLLASRTFRNCYYLIVQSFDAAAYAADNKQVLLWQTNMTTLVPKVNPTRHTDGISSVSLEEAIPSFLNTGAFYFGRETKPVLFYKNLAEDYDPAETSETPAVIHTVELMPDPSTSNDTAQFNPSTAPTGPDALAQMVDPSLFDKITLPDDTTIRPATMPRSDAESSKTWSFELLPTSFQRNPLLDFTIVTELTAEGRKLPPPFHRRPVYYLMTSGSHHVVGGQYGGGTPVQIEEFQRRLARALASNGYRPADEQNPPTQILRVVWGEHNVNQSPAYARRHHPSIHTYKELLSRAKTIGGNTFAKNMESAMIEQSRSVLPRAAHESPMSRFNSRYRGLLSQVHSDRYYLIVQSFDAAAYAQTRERVLLWQTNITIPATGVSLSQTMPALITNSAFFFGRETRMPVMVTKRLIESGVEIGETTVLEYMSGSATPRAGAKKTAKADAR